MICVFVYRALHNLPYTVYLNHHRTSTYVSDTVRTLAEITERFRPGEVYNIGGTEYHDVKTASDLILRCLGRDDRNVTYREAEPFTTRDKRIDLTKAVADLGHECRVSLADGIAKTVDWMRMIYGRGGE
jgi:dTDP-glucose 4,6-dehydratase